jgi:hypothetical protein
MPVHKRYMDLVLVIAQGIGLAAACGVRPFLPALAAGGLASVPLAADFDGTAYAYLESPAFLAAAAVALVVLTVIEVRRGGPALGAGPLAAALGGLAIGLGALLFAALLAGVGYPAWPGLIAGLGCAALAAAAARDFFGRVASRLDGQARSALVVYLEATSLGLALLALLAAPLALVALAALGVVTLRGRRRDTSKYAGLRVLR